MNTKEAISFLEKQGYKVYDDGTPADEKTFDYPIGKNKKRLKEIVGKKLYRVWFDGYSYGVYTGRELVKLAKSSKYQVNKDFKKFNNSITRQSTKRLIDAEKFDEIPPNAPPETEDPWAWD